MLELCLKHNATTAEEQDRAEDRSDADLDTSENMVGIREYGSFG